MPKTKAYKKSGSATRNRTTQAVQAPITPSRNTTKLKPQGPSSRNLFTSAMVSLGCWGFAFTYAFLTSDPNRYLYAGMAAVLALMWSVSFIVRLRKFLQARHT